MIDNILRRMHPDWNLYDALRRSKLRAKFHNEKRYGKRWAVLVAILGPSILFLCTSQLSRTVKDTTITLTTLEQIAANRISTLPCAMILLQLMNPITHSLLYNCDYRSIDINPILGQLHILQQTMSITS
ncbi:hypothetical protein EYZ11_005281 [Aspergillus tanneri]|uniref:Uncharacterized protein n=1 Tax=Aspergillus tanneri TaxID=1220188 RepID=A0A4S3JIQ7_9EURO|nr:hypothetical protein EYZ11_005281 [Aspergillus tanneri]